MKGLGQVAHTITVQCLGFELFHINMGVHSDCTLAFLHMLVVSMYFPSPLLP